MTKDDFAKPADLDENGEKAFRIVEAWRKKRGFNYTGGCKTYYSPKEWTEREEEYGCSSYLIIVHDGGDLSEWEGDGISPLEMDPALNEALRAAGMFLECCTCWYHAIYPI